MRVLTIDIDSNQAYLEDGCRKIHITFSGHYYIKTYEKNFCIKEGNHLISTYTGNYKTEGNDLTVSDPLLCWAIKGLQGVPKI